MCCLFKRVCLLLFFFVFVGDVPYKTFTFQALSPYTFLFSRRYDAEVVEGEKWRQAVRMKVQHYLFLGQYENGGYIIYNPEPSIDKTLIKRINYYLLMLPASTNYKGFLNVIFKTSIKVKTLEEVKNLFAEKKELTDEERVVRRLIQLVWLADEREVRPQEQRFEVYDYIFGTTKLFKTYEEFEELYISSMERIEDRPYLYELLECGDYIFGETFLDWIFQHVFEESQPGEHPAPAVEIMLHLIQKGVPLVLLPEVLHEFLSLSYPVYLKEERMGSNIFMSPAVPFQLIQEAIEHDAKLASNAPLLNFIEKYREILRRYEGKPEYAITLERALRAYDLLREQLRHYGSVHRNTLQEINASI